MKRIALIIAVFVLSSFVVPAPQAEAGPLKFVGRAVVWTAKLPVNLVKARRANVSARRANRGC